MVLAKETIWDLYLSVGKLPFEVRHNTSGNMFIVDDILTSGEFMFIPMVIVAGVMALSLLVELVMRLRFLLIMISST
jgi:hypothetical protein